MASLVALEPGTHKLGPDNAVLRVRTGRHGAAAKAGHDLVIEVTSWEASVEVDDEGGVGLELRADPGSLRVREGTGGVQELGDEDKAYIGETIADEILGDRAIVFRSTEAAASDDGRLQVAGELEMAGTNHPLSFELGVGGDGGIAGGTTVKQSEWGIKPYSTLFGTLKVDDEVRVEIEAGLPASR
jgi:hypothetical protein